MPFTLSTIKEQDLNLVQLTDLSTGIRVKILPDCGALLNEFSIPAGEGRLQAVSGYKDLADLHKNHPLFYRSAKLSPFPCRISKGQYAFDGETYEFENKFIDGSAIHGLLFNKSFTMLNSEAEDHQVSVVLEYEYKKENRGYPFDYKISVKYTLKKEGLLALETTVTNTSAGRIPLADGWHPYFSLGGKVNKWQMKIASREILELDRTLAPTGKLIPFDHFMTPALIGDDAYDHCFLLQSSYAGAACLLLNPDSRMGLSFFPDQTYPYLQIYTPDDRNSIAIENLSAAPNAFNNGLGLMILEPGQTQSFTTQYQLGLH
jgi:aldose 1-epimerase